MKLTESEKELIRKYRVTKADYKAAICVLLGIEEKKNIINFVPR